MDTREAAMALHGCEYGHEGSPELFAAMKRNGLVAVFGASDDLVEFRGAINDELGCWDGGTFYLKPDGLVSNKCTADECPYFERELEGAVPLDAVWDDSAPWTYRTDIPHETFNVMEDDETYCRGIVFRLCDARNPDTATG